VAEIGRESSVMESSPASSPSGRRLVAMWFVSGLILAIVTLLLAEFALRLSGLVSTEGAHTASESVFDKIPGMFEPDQHVTERPRPELVHRISINSLGFRGEQVALEKSPGKFRILCLGDSFTFGSYVNDEDTFPHLLGEKLRRQGMSVEVINAGVGGTTIVDQAYFLRKALVVKPDLVLLTFSENDVDDLSKNVPLHMTLEANRKWKSGSMAPIYQAVRDTALFNFALLVKARYVEYNRPHAVTSNSSPGTVDSKQLWEQYEREFGQLAKFLESQSIRFVFAVFPSNYRIGRALEPGNRLELATKVAERSGVQVIDLFTPLQASHLRPSDLYLLPYDGHPSRLGYEIVADAMASYLISHGLLEAPLSGANDKQNAVSPMNRTSG